MKRVIFHADAADIRLLCAAIGGEVAKRHGIVLAKPQSARQYGVCTGEPVRNQSYGSSTTISFDVADWKLQLKFY